MPRVGTAQKDWRPPCTKAQDPEAYRRVGEIVETIILNGQNPTKKTFREIDPELFDRFKESSIKNTISTWKRKILSTHKEEGINTDNKEEPNTEEREDSEDDEDFYLEDNQDNEYNSDDSSIKHQDSRIPSPRAGPSTRVHFANIPNYYGDKTATRPPTSTPTMQKKEPGNIMSSDIVNIPGNPKRVFMRIVENDELRRYLRIQICANAGPMNDVVDNFKLEVHPDGHGCDIQLPISPSFFMVENASLLGYHNEKNANVSGPIEHVSALRSRFENEDELYNMVESFTVSFGPLKVKKRLTDPTVKTKNIFCPTFVVYLEIIEEKSTRKQKISLDSDEDEFSPGMNTNRGHNPPVYSSAFPPFASPSGGGFVSPQGSVPVGPSATPAASAPHFFSSPHGTTHQTFYGPHNAPNHPSFYHPHMHPHFNNSQQEQHNMTNNPAPTPAAPAYYHQQSSRPTTAFASTASSGFQAPGTTDPSLIAAHFQNMSFSAGSHHHQPQQQQTTVQAASAPTVSFTAPQESALNTGQGRNSAPKMQSSNPVNRPTTGKYKRGERHIDVSASRDAESVQRMREAGRAGQLHVETVESDHTVRREEYFLSPASTAAGDVGSTVGTGISSRGNEFFPPAQDGLDV